MKYLLTTFLLTFGFTGFAQSNIQSSVDMSIQVRNEQLKADSNAPDRADFRKEEEYTKAKTKWIAENPETYEKIIAAPEPQKRTEVSEDTDPK